MFKDTGIFMVEDIKEQAENLITRLKADPIISKINVKFLTKFNEVKTLLDNEANVPEDRFYIIDINLGVGQKANDGLRAIKLIRSKEPNSFILAYSAYKDKQHECLEAGADLFFQKDPPNLEDDITKIKNTLRRLFALEEKYKAEKNLLILPISETEIFSQIVDIDEELGVVRLRCKLEENSDNIFERFFPLNSFEFLRENKKLISGTNIILKIKESINSVCFSFSEADKDFFAIENEEEINLNFLADSDIFKPL